VKSPYAALRADLRLELRTASIDVESAVLEWRMRTAALAQAFADRREAICAISVDYESRLHAFRKEDADFAARHRPPAERATLKKQRAVLLSSMEKALQDGLDDLRQLQSSSAQVASAAEHRFRFAVARQQDAVTGLRFAGVERARPSAAALEAIAQAQLLVIGPSNPLVSIGPILAVPGVRQAVESAPGARIGVSGIVAGKAIRGPADRMLASLGHEPTARGVADMYRGLLDRFVIDESDAELAPTIEALGMKVSVLPTVMRSDKDRAQLARALVALA